MVNDGQSYYCEICGTTIQEFKKTGKLGCPHCYEVFSKEIHRFILKTHNGTKHFGNAPARHRKQFIKSREISYLKSRLKTAVRSEDYEKAAKIRDKLRKIGEKE